MIPYTIQPELQILLAACFRQRLLGLLGRPPLLRHQALWLLPCKAIHTVGMRYSIDVVFLDRQWRIVRIESYVAPGRALVCFKAHSVVEFSAGFCQSCPDFPERLRRALAVAQNFPAPYTLSA